MGTTIPLLDRFPRLLTLPRADLGHFPTPVEEAPQLAPLLWIKREDLAADPVGGNKVRSLEFLLGAIHARAGDHPRWHRPVAGARLVTAGAYGSTHALATAIHAGRMGLRTSVLLWPQEESPQALAVRARTLAEAKEIRMVPNVAIAYALAAIQRLEGAAWIPPGGSTPLGTFGSVNAALELARQIREGALPPPAHVVLPLGSGGTTAGLLVGLQLAQLDVEVVGVRVVTRLVASRWRVLRLARRTRALLEQLSGERMPEQGSVRFRIVEDLYGGAYGRAVPEALAAADRFRAWGGHSLEPTYSGKAFAVALELAREGRTLFWLTFDDRMLQRRI